MRGVPVVGFLRGVVVANDKHLNARSAQWQCRWWGSIDRVVGTEAFVVGPE